MTRAETVEHGTSGAGEPTRLAVKVAVDADELREWAQRHADTGHHGVAHVLFLAAAGVESVTEQREREIRADERRKTLDEAVREFHCDNASLTAREVALVNANAVYWLRTRRVQVGP